MTIGTGNMTGDEMKKGSMEDRICEICKKPFPPKNKVQVICTNPECKKERMRRNSAAWTKKHKTAQPLPEYRICEVCDHKFKPRNHQQIICSPKCKKIRQAEYNKEYKEKYNRLYPLGKKEKKVQPDYEYRNTPKPKKVYYCQYPGCNKLTANEGTNRFLCQIHWDLLQEQCSGQYENGIYDVESRPGNVTGFKDGQRYGEGFI